MLEVYFAVFPIYEGDFPLIAYLVFLAKGDKIITILFSYSQ